MNKLILASTSPYRKELLSRLGAPFKALKPMCDEDEAKKEFNGSLKDLCAFLAKKKALSLQESQPLATIIGSDQALLFDNQILGKGKSFEGAFKQLSKLSGQSASLITAVYIHNPKKSFDFEVNTELKFKNLNEEQIAFYLKKDEPYDCAGSFKIEKSGVALFDSINTSDPTAIQGLPLLETSKVLLSLGFDIF